MASRGGDAKSGSSPIVAHRRRRSRPRWNRNTVIRVVVASLGALILAILVIRVSSTAILLGRGHPAVALVSPDDPEVIYHLATLRFSRGRGQADPASTNQLLAAARMTPLAEEPFFFAAVQTMEAGDRARSIALLEEARRRNPRTRLARLFLVDQYIRENRVAEAAAEIATLNRLSSEVGTLLAPQLSQLALDPQTRPALQRALGADPLLDEVLKSLVERGADSRLILAMASRRMAAYSASEPPEWQADLVRSQIERGNYREAHGLWRRFNRVQETGNSLYNPAFAELPGGPPFDWDLSEDAAGVAEPGRGGALEIVYYGRADVRLARQLMLLEPGRYRLEFAASRIGQAETQNLFWRISCARATTRQLDLPLARLGTTPRLIRAEFAVPANCPAQWIELVGESTEFPSRREVVITRLKLDRARQAG